MANPNWAFWVFTQSYRKMTCVMSDFSHLGLYSIFKFFGNKIFKKIQKSQNFDKKDSKILAWSITVLGELQL